MQLHKNIFNALCNVTKFKNMTNIHHKEAFERISEERKNSILDVAVEEFSSKGFKNANINIIAKNAGISIGLMYKYFATKEDLFFTCISKGMVVLRDTLEEIMKKDLWVRCTLDTPTKYLDSDVDEIMFVIKPKYDFLTIFRKLNGKILDKCSLINLAKKTTNTYNIIINEIKN